MKRHFQSLSLALALAFGLSGCGTLPFGTPGAAVDSKATALKRASGQLSVLVFPEAGPKSLIDAVRGAKKSIELETYMFTNHDASEDLIQALVARAKAGVDVRVILEANPYIPPQVGQPLPENPNKATTAELLAGGVKVKRSSPKFRFTHEKGMVIDGDTAYIMTLNFTNSGLSGNREYVVVDRDQSDVDELQRIFHADWEELTYVPKDPDLVVSPNNSRQKILQLIDSAKKSVVVQIEFLSDPEVAQHLGARAQAGVDVKVMGAFYEPDPVTGRDTCGDTTKLLNGVGVTNVRFSKTLKMHAKMIAVDGERAYVGSENLTSNSLDNNREVGIILQDKTLVGTLMQTAAKDWDQR
ncbi:MAG TPA: phospholipase D-like domain-containing protein [Stenomitos sp.]